MRTKLAGLVLLGLAGVGVAVALGATSNTVSVCATVRAQTIAANGATVGTIPAKSACKTVTYTVPDPVTVTVTTTAGTTTDTTPTTTTTEPPPTGEPGPIAGQGYHVAFADELSDRENWDNCIWYDCPPDPRWANFQTVENGVLNLRSSAAYTYPGGNWPMNTATTLSSGKSFQYGYFEARMKWTAGNGAWPAFWLIRTDWAQGSGGCPGYAGELDVFEGQGSEPNVFYGTIHKDSACGDDQQNGNNWHPTAFANLGADWHTYAALWTSTSVSWYLDDQLLMSAPTYATDNAPMFLLLQMWTGGWTRGPDSSTPDPLVTQVDWVHVWQR